MNGKAKQFLRNIIGAVGANVVRLMISVVLTLLLPNLWGLGVDGVFLAEPISNLIGGVACFTTMYLTVYRKLGSEEGERRAAKRKLER